MYFVFFGVAVLHRFHCTFSHNLVGLNKYDVVRIITLDSTFLEKTFFQDFPKYQSNLMLPS